MFGIPRQRTHAARMQQAWWALLVLAVLLGGTATDLFARHDHGILEADHHQCPACLVAESPAEPPAECASIGTPSAVPSRTRGVQPVAIPSGDHRPAAYLLRGPPPTLLIS